MSKYGNILSSLKFQKISDDEWILNEVLDNDIINYVTNRCNTAEGGLKYYVFGPDEPPAVTYIIVTIDTHNNILSVNFDMGKSGNCTRGMPLSFFEDIFLNLIEDKRDSLINKIFNK